jgi:glycopeptide antibiotics resistance protein
LSRFSRLDEIRAGVMPAGPPAPTADHYCWLAHGVFLLTFYGLLIPLRYQPRPFDEALAAFRQISYFDPSSLGARGDWVLSVVQFAVLSYLYMAAMCVDRRPAFGFVAAAIIVPGSIILSITLEFLQLYFPPRTVSLNDIAVESLGGLAGAFVWLLAGQRLTGGIRRFWNARGLSGLATQFLPAYFGLLLIVQLMPFDLTLGVDEIAQKYQEGKIGLLPFREMTAGSIRPYFKALTNAACFLPLGALAALVPRSAGWRWTGVFGFGLAVTGAVELLQLFVYSRHTLASDIVTGTAAILLGWGLARNFWAHSVPARAWISRPRVDRRGVEVPVMWMLLFCVWLGAMFLINWQPFDFTTDPARFADTDGFLTDENTSVYAWRRMAWAPLADYYWGSKYNAIDQFLQKSLSFAPLGIIMAFALRRGERPSGSPLVVFVALVVSLAIEAGQFFIPARHPSTTDLLIESFGAWLGFAAARHVAAALRADAGPSGRSYEFCR